MEHTLLEAGTTLLLWQKLAILGGWVGGIILLAETLGRLGLADTEVVRKIVHIGIGNVILLAWWLQVPTWVGVSASLLFSGVTLLSYWLPILPGINSVGRQSLGTFFYTLSFASLIALFWSNYPQFAALGILVMAWGDGLAALVGQTWGRHPYQIWGMKKSWEGTTAMFVISFMVAGAVLSGLPTQEPVWVVAGLVAIAATILESCSKFGVDNLTVPLGSGAIAFLLSRMFLV